ncbi:MAG: choice-of-anchor V domain-containing protein, partial [Chitinophagales bacterium]
MRKKLLYYVMIVCTTAFIYVHTASNSTGIMGKSNGCGGSSCHGNSTSANTVVKIKLDGDSTGTTYSPGKKYTVIVSVANNLYTATASRAGFDFTTTGGAFSAAPTGTMGMGTEIHHTTPKAMANTGLAEWTFEWTAPATGSGAIVMEIAGNATNGNAATSGDAFNSIKRNLAEGVATPPSISSVTSGTITTTGAKLDASVNANGTSTNVFVEYGLTTAYGTRVATTPATAAGSSATAVSKTLTGLTANTTYNYRFIARTATDSTKSANFTFKTT